MQTYTTYIHTPHGQGACRRLLMLLILMLVVLSSRAKLVQDEEGNYIIATEEDFRELMTNSSYWSNNHKFTQIADIDFGGKELTPIGNTTSPFTGIYEGNGHTLRKAVIYWNNASIYNYGIFGYICGPIAKGEYAAVRNLNIDSVKITRQEGFAQASMTGGDVKLGILAGQLGELVKINDISLRDCEITDNGQAANCKAVMAGSLAGDLYKNNVKATDPINAPELRIKNIYAQVDINLEKTTISVNDQQYMVGGILGRMRYATSASQLPDNTVFTGTLIAPRGSASPTISNMRGKSANSYATLVKTYAGEIGSALLEDAVAATGQSFKQFQSTRLYYNYDAYNSAKSTIEPVTDTYPAVTPTGGKYAYGTRTFAPNADNNGTYTSGWSNESNDSIDNWARVQGVNWGTYTDPEDEANRKRIIDMLTDGRTETNTCHWEWDDTDNTCKLVNDNDLKFLKVYIENDVDNNVYRVKLAYKDASIPYPGNLDYTIQWYSASSIQDNDWAPIPGANGLTIPANKTLFFRVEVISNGLSIMSDYIAPTRRVYVYNPTSNQEYNDAFADDVYKFNKNNESRYANAGRDINDGLTPETAVLTMARAYELLDEYGYVSTNSIVVMGYYYDDDYLTDPQVTVHQYAKPATITGTDNDQIVNGIFGLHKLNKPKSKETGSEHFLFFQAPLRLDNLNVLNHWTITGNKVSSGDSNGTFIICNFFDFTVDEKVSFINFRNVGATVGLPGNITSMPFITVVGGNQDNGKVATIDPIKYGNEIHYDDHPGFYTTAGATTINIRSGVFARIICCNRNGSLNKPGRNITGSPTVPNRIRLNVNIKDDIDMRDPDREETKYGYSLELSGGKIKYTSARYSHNIGLISGGQTDGSAYGDVIMNIYAGHIGRIITSNISFGRNTDDVEKEYPTDSFWGRSILNIYGNYEMQADGKVTSETTINEVFGGMLGRISSGDATNVVRPYFYGKSVINMYGGYIGSYTGQRNDLGLSALKNTVPNVYGVGSGGVTGLGYDEHHTTDKAIPYVKDDGSIDYGDYNLAKGHMPKMTMLDGEEIDLEVAKCEVNLYSGVITGSVYGGGYGYSSSLDKYDGKWVFQRAPGDLGVLYGDSKVTMYRHPDFQPPIVLGNVYGSGAGSSYYADHAAEADPGQPNRYLGVASQYGNTQVIISDGTVGNAAKGTGGDVYAGSQGVPGEDYANIAALYGSTSLIIEGGTIYGNIFGGSEIANINSHKAIPNSGNTHVLITGGTIGNNIFGGSKGIDAGRTDLVGDSKAMIAGNTNVTINGGDFIGNPFININQTVNYGDDGKPDINIVDNRDKFRTFNIYGGGYMNCDVRGSTNLRVLSSLLCNEASIVPSELNPNSIPDASIVDETEFHKAYMDITYRNFCVYGGGFGEKTDVLNTNVYVSIPRDRQHVQLPHGYALQRFLDHQSFFDIAGGGYSGDVGYWATDDSFEDYGIADNTPVKSIDQADFMQKVRDKNPDYDEDQVYAEVVKLYNHYEGGECNVTIDDYTFARKVIGGGFYGSCRTTNTHVRCGSLRQVYGGSLLGYVYDRAYLQFGNRLEDFVRWNPALNGGAGGYVYSETDEYELFKGDFENVETNYPDVFERAASFAKELNDYIFITENIYGGNDVKGIIGTKFWEAPESTPEKPIYGRDETDGAPLFCTDIDPSEEKGIVFNIYGGTFMGNIYSAGNGHYRGYFVPEWVRYNDGPVRMYRNVISSVDPNKRARAYRSRPMVGSVNVNLRGNSETDKIKVYGDFFGGGRECTIGQFNTALPLEDPRRLVAGGHLHVNLGGFTEIEGNVYLGAEGRLYSQQQCLPTAIDLKTFDGSTTKELAKLGNAAYDHWYYDKDQKCYLPGYPAADKVDGNFGMKGEHMLSSYMQNVQVQGDVELTFYRFLYERDADNHFTYRTFADGSLNRIRRHWIPGEIALDKYDAPSVVMNSFFLGGLSGSMTNNNVMKYTYPADDPYPGDEDWGCIYRVVLPEGVTVRDKVVMGSENATIRVYPYTDDYTDVVKTDANGDAIEPTYTYEGGMITQHTFTYDLIAYNDKFNVAKHYVPDDFYTSTNPDYVAIRTSNSYELRGGNDTIHRYDYSRSYIPYLSSKVEGRGRYSLALINILDDNGNAVLTDGQPLMKAYIGPREARTRSYEGASDNDLAVVSKLTLACKFDQLVAEGVDDPDDHHNHYGGNVYGGCYNSGIVNGDVVLNIGSNLLGKHIDESMSEAYNDYSSLKYNIGRVFGGGYGKDARVVGDTYVNLLRNFKGMNVFGGGMMGDVTGSANVTYIGTEESYVFGGIYGGGLQGYVGTPGETVKATNVRLFSGNVERVYGGSCMGDLHGRAFVELCDEVTTELDYLDYKRLSSEDWGPSRLIAGKVFGGNDIAGNITMLEGSPFSAATPAPGTWEELTNEEVDQQFVDFSTGVYLHEIKNEARKTSPGSNKGYNGFPLVGDLYGGSNGDYGVQGEQKYLSGTVYLATGKGIGIKKIDLTGMDVPHIQRSHLLVRGGSVINAYGGGDMSDIKGVDKITIDYPTDTAYAKARAGFETVEELDRVWTVLHFSSDQQKDEVTVTDRNYPKFKYQICRLFGGNNNADMGIQPTWVLRSGNIGSLYSGGNFGKMTYYQPHQDAVEEDLTVDPPIDAQAEVQEQGLTLTVDSYDLTINNVYGGGRLGDIDPDTKGVTTGDDFYGATLNIKRGIIEHVYGGNDVSGYVSYGTRVNLRGAISGDVYCAGNGNYLYQYDRQGQMYNYDAAFDSDGNLDVSRLKIKEDFAFRTDEYTGARYFKLPAKTDYGLRKGEPYEAADDEVIMAINSYRPHVERAYLSIAGEEDNKVWVRGNVYCGGNSASVVRDPSSKTNEVVFEIGDHVILNGVFLGSNGQSLTIGDMIMYTERLNAYPDPASVDPTNPRYINLNMVGENNLSESRVSNRRDSTAIADKSTLYPSVLDLYMRAVESTELPRFTFVPGLTDAYIGEFCVGGNRGSMMTDKCINITFPPTLTIFNHIIGGCKDADVTYNDVTHVGGLTKPLAGTETTKVDLTVKSKFRPLNLLFPDVDATPPISIKNSVVGSDGKPWTSGDKYYLNQQCNVLGGCYTSGTTVGDINIRLYSDMLNYECNDPADAGFIDKQAVINGMTSSRSWRSFTVVGAGYGAKTAVYGNVSVYMLPENVGTPTAPIITHPSVASIFGGSQEGLVVGNTKVEVRDGKVLANVYGASEAAKMYGSTSVIVGYPKYYKTLKSGNYRLNRVDYMSVTSRDDLKDEFDEVVVPKTVAYFEGDLVPQNVYEMINGRVKNSRVGNMISNDNFRVGKTVEDKYVNLVTTVAAEVTGDPDDDVSTLSEDYPRVTYYKGDLFAPVESSVLDAVTNKPIADHIVPQDYGVAWEDITIWIGDQNSNLDPTATYYGQGNVYGGGYVPNTTDRTLVGQPTVMRFTKDYNLGRVKEFSAEPYVKQDSIVALYGGNTAVMIWDDARAGEMDPATGQYVYPDSLLDDHVHIGAGYFNEVTLSEKQNVKGYFEKVDKTVPDGAGGTKVETAYVYLTRGETKDKHDKEHNKHYYEKKADGGVYGGGRKVFAQGFRSIDLAYYGYAGRTPQNPKLLNTIQRADVATVKDCCLELVGASDFTTNDYKDIYYAINRVGELRMSTSLLPNFALDEGYADDNDGIRIHAKRRSRNYIALYHKTHHLGAYSSDWILEHKYHGEDGAVTEIDDSDYNGYDSDGLESYVNHKHKFIEFYNDYGDLQDRADKDKPYTEAEIDAVVTQYNAYIQSTYTAEERAVLGLTPFTFDKSQPYDLGDYLEDIGQLMRDEFAKRNVGTSGNMIGISSGYELSFEGLSCKDVNEPETKYYGPAYGVTEMKMLTTVSGMGGGYVYALNHHHDPAVDNSSDGVVTNGWCGIWEQDFLQTTGNFVFPGAAYNTADKGKKYNYIIDDCYDYFDINHGYYQCNPPHDPDILRAKSVPAGVNHSHEVHYWYVSGDEYVYNVVLTAITSDSKQEFFLNNDNDRVNLFNVKRGGEIKVEEVNWFAHTDIPNDSCDILDMNKKYKLYLSLSNDPKNTLEETSTDKQGAYVIRIPRFTYEADEEEGTNKIVNVSDGGNKEDEYDTPDDNKIIDPNYYLNAVIDGQPNNNLFGVDADGNNVEVNPRLGLRLVDEELNRYADMGKEWSNRYYENHLKPDHMLQVRLATRSLNKDGSLAEPIYFVINIDIKYLMGPAVYGNINIENCALPGEYIYVNADSIEVVMDENLGIAEQKWRLYPNYINNDDGCKRYANPDYKADYAPELYPDLDEEIATSKELFYKLDTPEFTVPESEKLIHIPAYYYQNGWEPVYVVTANGINFERSLPYYKQVVDTETGKLVDDTDHPLPENRLQIHNYHRMKPMYNGEPLDLRLVEGARVYIEDEDDMNYFFEYLYQMQGADAPAKYKRFEAPDGKSASGKLTINPRYCQNLDFYQQRELHVPTASEYGHGSTHLDFKGNYHGNGNCMLIPATASIYMINSGNLYNTGFVSEVADDNTIIYNENYGTIVNSFYFNKEGYGALAKNGTLRNCYQNTPLITQDQDPTAVDFKYNELLSLTTQGFRYGQAAYNLNGFYLQKRHKLLHEAYIEKDGKRIYASNNPYSLDSMDVAVRSNSSIDYSQYAVDYIEKMFNNGDYRYAFYNQKLDSTIYTQFTEALRNADEPNYLDHKGNRANSIEVSMHDYSHKVDAARWCNTHKLYHPLYDKDYLFFGEDLTVDVDDHNEHLPEAYNPTNRVYRVGGYYGSKVDKGYFMNRQAYLDTPQMTAIDFVGYRDRDMYAPDGSLKDDDDDYDYKSDLEDDGWVIRPGYQEVFMAPTLDLPWIDKEVTVTDPDDPTLTTTTIERLHDFEIFDINSNKVTHNLLIYTEDLPEAKTVMEKYHYKPEFTYGQTDEYSFATHPDSEIRAHHIIEDATAGPVMYDGYFHLVDKHDFNAPVAFTVTEAWYNRKPQDYASEYSQGSELFKTAWEGICLPFDVGKVYAATTDKNTMRDMGELTHFSGDDWKGHEYWLRRYVGVSPDDNHKLMFERPTEANRSVDANGNPNRETVGDYTYSNKAIYELYKDFGYDNSGVAPTINGTDTIQYTHDLLYHYGKGGPQSRVIPEYRYLSRSMPYIVTYPGEYFYEFDLSGKFYASKVLKYKNTVMTPVPQTICYIALGERIPVTDDVPLIEYHYGDYSMKGTFMHVTDNAALAKNALYDAVSNLAVLDGVTLDGTEVHHGTEFKAHKGDMVVEPFRTYVTSDKPLQAPKLIGSRECIAQEEIEDEDEPDEPDTLDPADESIRVWVEGQKLVISTPHDLVTTIYDISGRAVRRIRAYEGINRYSGLPQGYYIVLRTKFAIL